MRGLIIVTLLTAFAFKGLAQQDPQYSLYMFNKQVLNPAYVGAPGAMNFVADLRSQWVGIDGHPNTGTFSFNAPVSMLHGGLGLFLLNDVIGPFNTTFIKGAYAFRLNLNSTGTTALQIGVSPGYVMKQIDFNSFRPGDVSFREPASATQDPILQGLNSGTIKANNGFDLGSGIYLHKVNSKGPEKFYIGVSADHLLRPLVLKGGGSTTFLEMSIVSTVGGSFRVGNGIDIAPSAYFRMAGSQMQVDANVSAYIYPFVLGVSLRALQDYSLVPLLGLQATRSLFVAYTYDYTMSSLGGYTSGSHELIFSYTWPKIIKFNPINRDVIDNKAPY